MQWVDLRGLSSSTRRVARMNTIATRRQLPLLLPSLPIRAAAPPPPRWLRDGTRAFSAGGLLRADEGRKNNKKKKKQDSPSIFEDLFPDEDVFAFPYRRWHNNQQDHRDDAEDGVKVRYLTSTGDKSEATEWKARREEASRQEKAAKQGNVAKQFKKTMKARTLWQPKMTVEEKAAKKTEFFETKAWAVSQIPAVLGRQTQADGGGEQEAAAAATTTDKDGDGGTSLFEELFKTEGTPRTTADGEQPVEDRSVNHGDLQAWIDSLPRDDGASAEDKERPAMLILSNASANLLESDFYRVGPQGQHLDGWGASISKVMQAYDYNTLEPLGRYFILFDSYAAAADYQREAQRRHNLVRRALQAPVAPYVPPDPDSPAQQPDPQQAFTLAAPSRAHLSLHLYRLDRATEARLEDFSVQGFLSMTPDPPPRAGSHVVLSLEGGATADQRTLSRWIRRDARDRNLGWPVQHLRPYFPPRIDRRRLAPGESPGEEDQGGPELGGQYGGDAAPALVDPGEQGGPKGPADETVRAGRFVLSFPDLHEARRFVRAWHRKEIVLARGQSVLVNTHFVW